MGASGISKFSEQIEPCPVLVPFFQSNNVPVLSCRGAPVLESSYFYSVGVTTTPPCGPTISVTDSSRATSQCFFCQPGKYSHAESRGVISCVDCSAGRASPLHGQPLCIECKAGHFAHMSGLSSCFACDAGYSTNAQTGSSACVSCVAGKYAASPGSAYCMDAPAGSHAFQNGSINPFVCDGGTFSFAGSAECFSCPAGKYGQASGMADECNPCPVGYFSNRTGAVSVATCLQNTCTPGSTSLQGSTSLADCHCVVDAVGVVAGSGSSCVCRAGFAFVAVDNACKPCKDNQFQPSATLAACRFSAVRAVTPATTRRTGRRPRCVTSASRAQRRRTATTAARPNPNDSRCR
jgi:hypothetical protein